MGVSSDMYAFSACAVCVRVFLPTGGTEDYYINDECTACAWSVSLWVGGWSRTVDPRWTGQSGLDTHP